MSNATIRVERISKKYCRTIKNTMVYGVNDLFTSFLGFNQNSQKLRSGEFWAIDDVSLELAQGECLGLIGPNGSGKSTLLKLLNGIFMPDRGKIEITGKVSALIEIGAGFHPLLTGRENIFVFGAILGMSKKKINKEFDSIIDFAEIEGFIDTPIKYYSSGMCVRLGFSIAAHLSPDILLIDEILSVGDLSFQIKCMNHIQKLIQSGVSIIFVSHNLYQIERICNSSMIIEHGKVKIKGSPGDIVNIYEEKYGIGNKSSAKTDQKTPLEFKSVSVFSDNKMADFTDGYYKVETFKSLKFVINYILKTEIPNGIQIGLLVKTVDGQRVFGTTTSHRGMILPGGTGNYTVCFEFPQNQLLTGNYYVNLSAFNLDYTVQMAAWERAIIMRVLTPESSRLHTTGIVSMPYKTYLESR